MWLIRTVCVLAFFALMGSITYGARALVYGIDDKDFGIGVGTVALLSAGFIGFAAWVDRRIS